MQIMDFITAANNELFQAVEDGDLEKLFFSIWKGADVNARNDDGETPFSLADLCNNSEIQRALLINGAIVEEGSDFMEGVRHEYQRFRHGNGDVICELAEDNSLVESLFESARSGNIDLARWAIEEGADVNCKSLEGETAYSIADCNGHSEVQSFLVLHGAETKASGDVYMAGVKDESMRFRHGNGELVAELGNDNDAEEEERVNKFIEDTIMQTPPKSSKSSSLPSTLRKHQGDDVAKGDVGDRFSKKVESAENDLAQHRSIRA